MPAAIEEPSLRYGDAVMAKEIAKSCPLSDEGRACLQEGQTPNSLLGELVRRELYADALRFTAYKLPPREDVWWAALCLWDAQRPEPSSEVNAAFQAIIDWVEDPGEKPRRAADSAGRRAGMNTPAGMVCMAIYFSGGSISLPECPEVKPDPQAAAQQIAAALVLAAKTNPVASGGTTAAQRRFLVLAAQVEEGKLPWTRADDV